MAKSVITTTIIILKYFIILDLGQMKLFRKHLTLLFIFEIKQLPGETEISFDTAVSVFLQTIQSVFLFNCAYKAKLYRQLL